MTVASAFTNGYRIRLKEEQRVEYQKVKFRKFPNGKVYIILFWVNGKLQNRFTGFPIYTIAKESIGHVLLTTSTFNVPSYKKIYFDDCEIVPEVTRPKLP